VIRVAHIITGLGIGGAEMMLYKLLSRMDRNAFDAIVVSLSGEGAVGDLIHGIGIPIIAMEMRARRRPDLDVSCEPVGRIGRKGCTTCPDHLGAPSRKSSIRGISKEHARCCPHLGIIVSNPAGDNRMLF